jgi:hypothetical protein
MSKGELCADLKNLKRQVLTNKGFESIQVSGKKINEILRLKKHDPHAWFNMGHLLW